MTICICEGFGSEKKGVCFGFLRTEAWAESIWNNLAAIAKQSLVRPNQYGSVWDIDSLIHDDTVIIIPSLKEYFTCRRFVLTILSWLPEQVDDRALYVEIPKGLLLFLIQTIRITLIYWLEHLLGYVKTAAFWLPILVHPRQYASGKLVASSSHQLRIRVTLRLAWFRIM